MACADSRAIEESRTALNSFISACKDNPETQPNATAVGRLVRCAASDVGRPTQSCFLRSLMALTVVVRNPDGDIGIQRYSFGKADAVPI